MCVVPFVRSACHMFIINIGLEEPTCGSICPITFLCLPWQENMPFVDAYVLFLLVRGVVLRPRYTYNFFMH